jgi:hypothetical protein
MPQPANPQNERRPKRAEAPTDVADDGLAGAVDGQQGGAVGVAEADVPDGLGRGGAGRVGGLGVEGLAGNQRGERGG